jgi:hypothetical protein
MKRKINKKKLTARLLLSPQIRPAPSASLICTLAEVGFGVTSA